MPPVFLSRRNTSHLAIALGLFLHLNFAYSGETAENRAVLELNVEQATELATIWLEQGKTGQAEKLLKRLRSAPRPSLQVRFLSGQLAGMRGNWGEAIEEYRAILITDPKAVRVRLELARALSEIKDYPAAIYHFELALSEPLPEAAQKNVLRFVRDIRFRLSRWEVRLDLMSDTNINNATKNRDIVIFGNHFTLSDEAMAKHGAGWYLALFGRQALGDDLSSFAQVQLESYDYSNRTNDRLFTQATLGKTFGLADHLFTLEIGGHGSSHAGKTLYTGGLARISDGWRINPGSLVTAGYEYKQLDYADIQYLSGHQGTLNLGYAHAFGGDTIASLGGFIGYSEAQEKPYSYRFHGLRASISHELPDALTVGARFESYWLNHNGDDIWFGYPREDTRSLVEVDFLRRDWSWQGFSPRLILGGQVNHSNIPLYEFDRAYFRISFSREF